MSMDLINAKVYVKKGEFRPEERDNKKIIISIVFFVISLLLGVLIAFASDNAINNSKWTLFSIIATISVSILMINILLNPSGKGRILSIFIFFVPISFFGFSYISAMFSILAALIMSISVENIHKYIMNMRKIHIGQAMNMGVGGVLIALSIAVSGQYFATMVKQETKEFIPKINEMRVVNNLLERYILKNEHGGVMTVDNFIKKFLKTESFESLNKLESFIPFDKELPKNNNLETNILESVNSTLVSTENKMVKSLRNDMSKKINKNLTGNENIIDVLTELMQIQLEKIMLGNSVFISFIPKVFSLLLFLILVSASTILKFPIIWISTLLFRFLQFTNLFKIVSVNKKVECIVFKK